MLLSLLQIAIIIVCIIDLTDINITFKKIIGFFCGSNYQNVKVNLCSLCITWWLSLLYIIILNQLTITNIMWCAIIAISTTLIQAILRLGQDIIIKLIDKIYEIIQ